MRFAATLPHRKSMIRSIFSAFLGLLLAGGLQAREPSSTAADLAALEIKVRDVSAKVLPATVALISEKTGSSGSGVIVDKEGLILTAAHVVQGAETLTVVFPDGKQAAGKVLGANYSKDIGMVRITSQGTWPFVALGNSRTLKEGDWVVALGHSAGFDPARTPPVRFGRVMSRGPGNFFTSDCTLIGGDSGGPIFDLAGKLIGINSSIGRSWSNNNHAGIDGFREDWDRMLQGESWGTLQMNPLANPEMPVLGIGMAGDIWEGKGVLVDSVVQDSPAAAAGVRRGDVLIELDGSGVDDGGELLRLLAKRVPGEKVKLAVLRDDARVELTATLKAREILYEQGSPFLPNGSFDAEIPLQSEEEAKAIAEQTNQFNGALISSLAESSRSTVRIWANDRKLAYGTVIGDGSRILTKWSQVARFRGNLIADPGYGPGRHVVIDSVYEDEDLAVLKLAVGAPLTPIKWSDAEPARGAFVIATQPGEKPAGFGVVSVPVRNLRETDQAFLGVTGDISYSGKGVRIEGVEKGSGAAQAGMKRGYVILKVGDRLISGVLELRNVMTGIAPGSRVQILAMTPDGEKTFDVLLGNREEFPGVPQARLSAMERMGGPVSAVRGGFPRAVQTDMRLAPDQMGGPVVDLEGRVIGVMLARADRTRSFYMPANDVVAMLAKPGVSADLAKVRVEENAREIAMAEQENRGSPLKRPPSVSRKRLRQHFEEMEELMSYMDEEMRSLARER